MTGKKAYLDYDEIQQAYGNWQDQSCVGNQKIREPQSTFSGHLGTQYWQLCQDTNEHIAQVLLDKIQLNNYTHILYYMIIDVISDGNQTK